LEEFCKAKNLKIVDHYTDAGVSGGKPAFKRPQMSRLLADVEAGKIDMILFTKLDRWFRNTKEYFKVQDILERHRVAWKAIHEDYDTTTSNGNLAITIFLAIAQNEREKGSERVKSVLDNKRKNKEACFGGRYRFPGYMKEPDENGIPRLVIDPDTEPHLREFWRLVCEGTAVKAAGKAVNSMFGISRCYNAWLGIYHNDLYRGTYKGVPDFCPAYLTEEEWQECRNRPTIKKAQKQRCYLFTGLLRCPSCGNNLASGYTISRARTKREYLQYRCNKAPFGLCDNKSKVSELAVEAWLLQNIKPHLAEFLKKIEVEEAAPKPKPKRDKAKIQEHIRRLNVVYMGGGKSDEEYMEELGVLKRQLAEAERESADIYKHRDLRPLQEFLESDLETIYRDLPSEDKRQLWRSIIDHIILEGNRVVDVEYRT
jgi:DNA invertase Pin-like site-specific DNA recombinase